MSTSKFLSEIIIAGLLIVLVLLHINPFPSYMPGMTSQIVFMGLIVIVALFIGLVWKERPADEREQLHSLKAGKLSYLAGILVLAIGTLYQIKNYSVDPWILWALIVMVGVKLASRVYEQIKN